MKKIILTLFVVLLTASIALASWQDTFSSDYTKNSTGAVANALALGASPGEIIDVALAIEGVQAELLATAMCDAGLSPQDLQGFLPKLGGMNLNALMTACGSQDNISSENQFAGTSADSSSESKRTNYDGGAGATPIQLLPASGNDFNQ